MFPSQWVNQLVSGVVTWNGTRWVTNLPTQHLLPHGHANE